LIHFYKRKFHLGGRRQSHLAVELCKAACTELEST